MVTKEVAEKYHLEKVSDLKKYKDELRLGMDTQWMNRAGDGYPAFQKEYGFKFASARPMQIGLVYDALKIKIRCCCWLFNRWTYCCLRFENLKR